MFQTTFASFLALMYCLVQMLVLVGVLIQIFKPGGPIYCNIHAMFFIFVASTFILCGLFHPQEVIALLSGFTYYLAIPTMYMILMIYAVCNLNNVSWGTREVKQTPSEEKAEEFKKQTEELQMLKDQKTANGSIATLYQFFGLGSKKTNKATGACCQRQCACCYSEDLNSAADEAIRIKLVEDVESLKNVVKRNEKLTKKNAKRQEVLIKGTCDVITGKRDCIPDELALLTSSSDSSDDESKEVKSPTTNDEQADDAGQLLIVSRQDIATGTFPLRLFKFNKMIVKRVLSP
jgi:hypothetical protein